MAEAHGLDLTISGLHGGAAFDLNVDSSISGEELRKLIGRRVAPRPGGYTAIVHGTAPLDRIKPLREQGLTSPTDLQYVYVRMKLYEARKTLAGQQPTEYAGGLEGATGIIIQSNHFLAGVAFPHSLQTLTLGEAWRHSERICLTTFRKNFNQSLDGVTLPNGLKTLTFGDRFDRSLDGVTLPNGLQTLTFGYDFNRRIDGVTLPNGLQTLTFGYNFNQSLDGVTLPNGLQTLTFGRNFNQSLDGVNLPDCLQHLCLPPFSVYVA